MQGKSLSLISSSLSYLRDAKAHARSELVASIRAAVADSDALKDEPEWVIEHEIKSKLDDVDRQERELEDRLAKIREREREETAALANDGRRSMARKRQVSQADSRKLYASCPPKQTLSDSLSRATETEPNACSQKVAAADDSDFGGDDQFAPTPYYEDQESAEILAQAQPDGADDNYSPAVRALLDS